MSLEGEAIGTVIGYTSSELELLDANCLTALSFSAQSEKEIIDKMGRRAKARKRAARIAAENQAVEVSDVISGGSDETDCEIPSIPSKPSPSRIPVLQKGYQVTSSKQSEISLTSPSKIPRPCAIVHHLKPIDVEYSDDYGISTHESIDEPPSFTTRTDTFTNTEMISGATDKTIPDDLTPLPICDLSTEYSTLTEAEVDPNQVVVIADANGTELKFDMQAMLEGLDLSLVGLRFL